jgi:hypothetical protein
MTNGQESKVIKDPTVWRSPENDRSSGLAFKNTSSRANASSLSTQTQVATKPLATVQSEKSLDDWLEQLWTKPVQTKDDVWKERRITTVEARILKRTINETINKTDTCKKYIADLINTVASIYGVTDKIISTDIETLFDKVLNSRSWGGDDGLGGILISDTRLLGNANHSWDAEGGGWGQIRLGFAYAGGYEHTRIKGARGKEYVITNRLDNYDNLVDNITSAAGALLAIHELMHTANKSAGGDIDYAKAVAQLAGEADPKFEDANKASVYWDNRLRQACGVNGSSGQMTNYKLYK